jgi:GNAT superfamily N-acetyltransferase
MELSFKGYIYSDDKCLLSCTTVHRYLSEESYWAQGRDLDTVKRSIENSLSVGVYTERGEQVGFARVITDYATTYYVCDLFILPSYRKSGLGKRLVKYIVNHPLLDGLSGILLTKDAHGLYSSYGFSDSFEIQRRFMLKKGRAE